MVRYIILVIIVVVLSIGKGISNDFNYEESLVSKKVNIRIYYNNVQRFLDYELYLNQIREAGLLFACSNLASLEHVIKFEKDRLAEIKRIQEVEEIRALNTEEHERLSKLNIESYLSTQGIESCVEYFDPRNISVSGEYKVYRNELIAEIISLDSREEEQIYYVLAISLIKSLDMHNREITKYID